MTLPNLTHYDPERKMWVQFPSVKAKRKWLKKFKAKQDRLIKELKQIKFGV